MAKVRQDIDWIKLRSLPADSRELDSLMFDRARSMSIRAQSIYSARQKASNEFRTSETTPPKYIKSFKLERVKRAIGFAWRVENTDPGAAFVEYGAHAGGRTFVLRYFPLRAALMAEGITQ